MSLDVLFAQLTTTKWALPFYGSSSLMQATDKNLEESKTYNWDGAKMTAEVGGAIPVVYGRHLVAPNLINVYIEEGENDTLNMLLAVCEGEIESISNIKLNNNPIENSYGEAAEDPYGENAEITIRKGPLDQEPIENFGDIHSLVSVTQVLRQGISYEYTTIKTNVEAFKIEFYIDKLFQLDGNQNELAWYCSIQVEYRIHGETDWIMAGVHEVNKKIDSAFTRAFKSDYLLPGQYDIKVTKVSSDPDVTHFGEVRFNSVDEITTQDLIYPCTALVGIRLVASKVISGALPNVTCLVTGTKVRVPDIRDGSGNQVNWEDYFWDTAAGSFKSLAHPDLELLWDGSFTTAWSANPVWCLRNLLTNTRYGLGEFVKEENIDEVSFLAAAKFCDEGVLNLDGNLEKRMRLDIVLDTKERALDSLYRICDSFRGLLHIASGKIRLVVEKEESSSFTFNMSNIIKDSLNIKYTSRKVVPNVLNLQFTNKEKNYQRDSLEIGDESSIAAGEEIRSQTVQFIGCTRVSQVLREGTILLKKLKYNMTQISFGAGLDTLTCQVGDVFGFQHDLPAWGEGGRLRPGATYNLVKLDKPIILDLGKTYEIEIRNLQTDRIEKRTIAESGGAFEEVHITEPFSFLPGEYDLWSFGEQNYVNKLYRIMSIIKGQDARSQISAIEYNPDVYDYSGITIPRDEFKYLTMEIPDVSNLTAEEKVTRLPDGTIDDVINVAFTKPPTGSRWIRKAVKFEIYLSDNDGKSWNFIASTDTEFYTLREPFTKGTRYTVAVVSVTEDGEKKVPANSPSVSLTIEGWKIAPIRVNNFSYTFEDEIKFTWDKNPEGDLAGYEIRIERDNWGIRNSQFTWRGRAESYTVVRPTARDGVTYYIKAFNTSGVFSATYAYLTPINPAPGALALTYTNIFQKVLLTWPDSPDVDLIEYEIWQNDNEVWLGYQNANEKLIHKSKGTSAVLLVPHNLTYYRVRGADKFGPGEFSNVVRVQQITLDGALLTPESIDEVRIAPESITAPKIVAGAIQTAHIGALQITAEKMNVAELSAISANLGKILAGTVVGACIKTSEQIYRTELNNAGLFSYDEQGKLTIKLSDGQLCLIDPVSSNFYSYLDAGTLKFHYPYGSIPYAKRICSGVVCSGATVTLCHWYERPEAIVSLKKLMAYNAGNKESCQDWCVYADNFRWFDYGGENFGWKFDVHAKLVISGGTRPECILLYDFDQTYATGLNTCLVLTREMFQLWCHACAPDTFKYGVSNYEVRYRPQGSGVWCACQYQYTQPHGSVSQMTTTNITCQTIHLGAGNVYEVQIHQNSLAWYDSGIQSGITCCLMCCFQYSCQVQVQCWYLCCYWYCVDCSYSYTCCYRNNLSGGTASWNYTVYNAGSTQTCTWVHEVPITGYPGGAADVYYSYLSFSVSGKVQIFGSWPYPYQCCSYSLVCVGNCMWCIYDSGSPNPYNFSGGGTQSFNGAINSLRACGQAKVVYQLPYYSTNACNQANISGVSGYTCYCCTYCCYLICCYLCCYWYSQWEWVTCWYWCCYWYTCYYGEPAYCEYKKFYSIHETTAIECILDPYGEVNYLAVAYA